jgi:hypothetical protein
VHGSRYAAIAVAGIAAKMLDVFPQSSVAEIKAALIKLAMPLPNEATPTTRHGQIQHSGAFTKF